MVCWQASQGSVIAFALMFVLHIFGTMGAGDVKLFAAIGAVVGSSLVLPTLLVVALTGACLLYVKMIYSRRVGATMFGVFQFFYGLLLASECPVLKYLQIAAIRCLTAWQFAAAA